MTKRAKRRQPWRLSTPPRIRPEGGRKVALGVPPLPVGKFTHCEGQLAMDFDSDAAPGDSERTTP